MWPALWFLGNDFGTAGWPACGETDLMELVGTNPHLVTGSIHWLEANGAEGTLNNTYTLPNGADYSQKQPARFTHGANGIPTKHVCRLCAGFPVT
ncbi:MAG TPA: hypothetical protein VHW43_04975 [Puia sp.]|nr:hypothetical protein [Puia sp.]